MWQYIAITIIGLLVLFHLSKKIYKAFTNQEDTSPCRGCSGKCPIPPNHSKEISNCNKKEK